MGSYREIILYKSKKTQEKDSELLGVIDCGKANVGETDGKKGWLAERV